MGNAIVFVDSRLSGHERLISGSAEVVVLDQDRDGLAQIASYLDGRSGLDAIHVVSHGAAGTLRLGSTRLDATTLDEHADEFRAIGRSLTTSGDILFYACNLAQGDAGL